MNLSKMDFENEQKIIGDCKDFLIRSANRYSNEVKDQERKLEALSGDFWDADNKKDWKIGKKPILHHNIFEKIVNGVSSPLSRSPYHINLNNQKLEDLQESLNTLEHSEDAKNVYQEAFYRACGVGAGYVVCGVDDELKPMIEFAEQQSSIAIDPDCEKADCRDAEEGATIRFISIAKARRLYGEDVIPNAYPNECDGLDLSHCNMWKNQNDYVQVVNYYRKENNAVTLYKICGRKVIAEPIKLPIDRIPIVRFAGFKKYRRDVGIDYTGLVHKLWDSQTEYDLTWTNQMSRMCRTLKARAVVGITAMDGVKEYLQKMEQDDSLALVYNDQPKNGVVPQPPQIKDEVFNTGDLTQVLSNVRQCIPDISGIPLDGIQNVERTATEILTQQENNENNVAILYTHAESATRTIGRICIMLLNGGNYEDFSLENGPAIITKNMKRRQEINAIAQFYPEDRKMLLAPYMAKTIDSNIANEIENVSKANLPDGLDLLDDMSDGAAVYALKQTQKQFNEAISKANELKQQNEELTQQVRELTLANSDMKSQQAIDIAKFEAQFALQVQQAKFENDSERNKFIIEYSKLINDAKLKEEESRRKNAEVIAKIGGSV